MNNEERLIAQLKAQYNAQPLPPHAGGKDM